MKNLIYILFALLIVSCNEVPEAKVIEGETPVSNERVVEEVKVAEAGPYSNPAIIYGSNFGVYFQALYKIGDFETMLKFTSKESIDKHGEDRLFEFYQVMKFGFDIKPNAMKEIGDSTYILSFKTVNVATRNIRRMKVVVENDSCKVVLPSNLKDFMSGNEVIERR